MVTIDKSGANTAALNTLNGDKPEEGRMTIRQSKYLNNLVGQDHRNIKRCCRPMLGFSSFRRAQTILSGIELVHILRKGQLHHPASAVLSSAEQFYCWPPKKRQPRFFRLPSINATEPSKITDSHYLQQTQTVSLFYNLLNLVKGKDTHTF